MNESLKVRFVVIIVIIIMSGCATGHITGSLIIKKPIEEVFDVVSDFRNEPAFNPNMIFVELDTIEPIGVGTRFKARVKSRSDTINMIVTYTGYKKDEYIRSLSVSDNMEINGGLKFSQVEDGTLFEWYWDIKLSGKLKLFGPLVSMMGKKQEYKIWRSLKDKIEKNSNLAQ